MENMSLKEITDACHGTYFGADELLSKKVSGVIIDSRKAEKDVLFVPIKGARADGHTFIPQVMEQGALCTLSEQPLEHTSPYILVESCAQALKDIAGHYRKALGIKIVGISGSVGKTSTKEMIASILEQKYSVLKTAGNFNNEIGLPLTVFRIRPEHDIAVLEMGISGFGEMSRLAAVARPDICVLTNIGQCHLENLKDRDGVLRAKTEMFAFRREGASIILNGDDDKLAGLTDIDGTAPVFFGVERPADFYADEIENLGLKGTACRIHTPAGDFTTVIPVPGAHSVYNALAGTVVGVQTGLTLAEIKAGIESLKPVSGRNHTIETEKLTILDDCYNANPVSMKASLDVLSMALGRKVAILGDMFELGEGELGLHREVGSYAAQKGIDVLCCIGTLSKAMADGASEALAEHSTGISAEAHPDHSSEVAADAHAAQTCDGENADLSSRKVLYFATKADFLAALSSIIEEHDTLLVKASHGMEFPEIVEALKNW